MENVEDKTLDIPRGILELMIPTIPACEPLPGFGISQRLAGSSQA